MATTRALTMDATDQTTRGDRGSGGTGSARVPMCYYCSSMDTMEPYSRSDRVFLLSTLFPRVRARYCRTCTRHFLHIAPRSRR